MLFLKPLFYSMQAHILNMRCTFMPLSVSIQPHANSQEFSERKAKPKPHLAWLKQLHQAVSDMTTALSVIDDVNISERSRNAQLKPIVMSRMHTTLLATSELVLPLMREEATSTRTEYTMFVADFAKFLAGLVPQLRKRGLCLSLVTASSIGTADEHVFWELWSCLEAGCKSFCRIAESSYDVWPENEKPFYPSLCAAFHSLLHWLLSMSRSSAWQLMRPEHCLHMRNDELLLMLSLPIGYLTDLATAQFLGHTTHFDTLSPNLLSMLCCIVTEQFGCAPLLVPRSHTTASMKASTYTRGVVYKAQDISRSRLYLVIDTLVVLIYNLTVIDDSPHRIVPLTCLTAPAVIQFSKVAVMIQIQMQPHESDLVERSMSCLMYLLNLSLNQSYDEGGLDFSPLQRSNKDALGLPTHLNQALSDAALETDRSLLHTLSCYMDVHLPFTELCCRLQYLLVQIWKSACRLHPFSSAATSKIAQSIIGLAKQCTTHGLMLMQYFKADKGNLKSQQRARTQTQKEMRKQAQSILAKLSVTKHAIWNDEGMKALRNLTLAISHFKLYSQGTNVNFDACK